MPKKLQKRRKVDKNRYVKKLHRTGEIWNSQPNDVDNNNPIAGSNNNYNRNEKPTTISGDDINRHQCSEESSQQKLFNININQAADWRCRICDRIWYRKGIR